MASRVVRRRLQLLRGRDIAQADGAEGAADVADVGGVEHRRYGQRPLLLLQEQSRESPLSRFALKRDCGTRGRRQTSRTWSDKL